MGLEFASPYNAKPDTVLEAVKTFLDANSTTFCNVSLDRESRRFDFDFCKPRWRDDGSLNDVLLLIEERQIYLCFSAGLYQDAEQTVQLLSETLNGFGIVTEFEEP